MLNIMLVNLKKLYDQFSTIRQMQIFLPIFTRILVKYKLRFDFTNNRSTKVAFQRLHGDSVAKARFAEESDHAALFHRAKTNPSLSTSAATKCEEEERNGAMKNRHTDRER